MRCRASCPAVSVTRPRACSWATVWLAAEWVTETAPARVRIELGPSAVSARTMGENLGR